MMIVFYNKYIIKHVCNFLDHDDKLNTTQLNKTIYDISDLIYWDFWYDYYYFVRMTYNYKLTRVRKIKNYNGGYIDYKIWDNIHSVKCTTEYKQTDIHLLMNKKYVSISGCKNITDISDLKDIITLDISGCKNITDITFLMNNYNLDLSDTRISDVSMLCNVKILRLRKCKNITDVSPLQNVCYLDLYGCVNISDISMLSNVNSINICYTHVTDVSALNNVNKIYIDTQKYYLINSNNNMKIIVDYYF